MGIAHHGTRLIVRAAWFLATILAASTFLSILHQPVGWLPGVAVIALGLGAAVNSYNALLILAGLGPLSATIFALMRNSPMGLDFGEAMVLAFLSGCCARRGMQSRPLTVPRPFAWATGVLLALALASGVVDATVLRVERPDLTLSDLTQYFFTRDYFLRGTAIRSTMLFLEGIALMVMAAETCRGDRVRRDRLLRMMVVGAATAAFFNVIKILTSAMRQPDVWTTFFEYLASARVNIHFPDLNAAGSYFALMLFVAVGFIPRAPVPASLASVAIALGLWIAGSRTALAAALGGACLVSIAAAPSRRSRVALGVAAVVLSAGAVLVAWTLYPQGRNAPVDDAVSYRIVYGKIAVDLTMTHPWFGIGLGNFFELSGIYQNNAHNNFLQVSAELGIPALLLFMFLLWFAVRASWREEERWGPAKGLSVGLAVFLLTCLAGHPLLISGVAYPFWMALGLAVCCVPPAAPGVRVRSAAVAAILIIAVTLPFRASAAARAADIEHASVGFSKWQQQPDGLRYRWAGGRASFFASPAARSVRIPLRLGPLAPPAVEVRLFLDGIEANRVVLRQGDELRIVRLNLIRRATTRFARIDLEARTPGTLTPLDSRPTDSAGVLLVGRPILEN